MINNFKFDVVSAQRAAQLHEKEYFDARAKISHVKIFMDGA
jgi:hypothetical protein